MRGERRERATRTERAGEAARERVCKGVRGQRPSVNTVRRYTMKQSTRRFVVALCAGALVAGLTVLAQQAARPLGALVVPAGFKFEVFAENVGSARTMALGAR